MDRKLLSVLLVIVISIIKVNAQFSIYTANPSCYGYGVGEVQPPVGYHYHWSNGGTNSYIQTTISGIYSCTVSDTFGNPLSVLTDTIIIPPPITYTYSTISPTSCDSCNGSISVVTSGGVPPYTIFWYDSSPDSSTHKNACPGIYGFEIDDAHQCRDTMLHAAINCNCGLNVTLTQNNISCDTAYGSVTANVAGGHAPYSYSWYDTYWGTTSASPAFTQLATGAMWTLTVTDSAACRYYATGNILNSVGYNYYVISL